MIENYLRKRENLQQVFVLIDSRHSPQKMDIEFLSQLRKWDVPFTLIFTKADKEKPGAVQRNTNLFFEKMREAWQFLPQYFVTSAISKEGKEEILDFIDDSNKAFAEHKHD